MATNCRGKIAPPEIGERGASEGKKISGSPARLLQSHLWGPDRHPRKSEYIDRFRYRREFCAEIILNHQLPRKMAPLWPRHRTFANKKCDKL